MKYKIIVDKDAEEEIIAIVHAPSSPRKRECPVSDLPANKAG